jgi:uncharacterized protein
MSISVPCPWYRRVFPVMGLGGVLAAGGGAGWFTDLAVTRLTDPRPFAVEPWMTDITSHPEASGFSLQRFPVATADGYQLQAMMLEPTTAAGSTKRGQVVTAALQKAGLALPPGQMRGTLILLHGFNTRKEHLLTISERFCAAGFRCVIYDSRGHGDSGGQYATFGSHETDDLHRVINAARPLAGKSGFGPLGLFGYSMGGAIALQAQPGLPEVKALATAAAFADFRDIIAHEAARQYRGIGTPLVPLVRGGTQWKAGFDPWDIRPVEAARHLTCPLFLVQGTNDPLIPPAQAQKLAAAAGTHLWKLNLIPGANHNVFTVGGDALWGELAVFFAGQLGSL